VGIEGSGVDWVKLATRYYDDAAIEGMDDAAEVMFVRGIARAGELEREGFIPSSSLPKLTRRRRYETLVEQLVASGLWISVPGGVQVTSWSDWQDALDDLARRRTADRDRQRRRRERAKSTPSRDNGHVSRDVTATEEELEKELPRGSAKTDGWRSTSGSTSFEDREEEPQTRCDKHRRTVKPPPCGPCADARREHNRWQKAYNERIADSPKCRVHRGELAYNCRLCRAEELAPA
jgi:hypothetical protein